MTVATVEDVARRVGRPLTTLERGRVEALLEDVEVEIARLAPSRLTAADWRPAVISVECSVVIRAARLPDALTQVIPDPEATGYQSVQPTQGDVTLRRKERRTLGLPNTASVLGAPVRRRLPFEEAFPDLCWIDGWTEEGWCDDGF